MGGGQFDEVVIRTKIAFGKYFSSEEWSRFENKFREMDQDGSGYLSLEDLKRCQEKMDNALTHANLKEMLNELAVENPEKGLSFSEYIKIQLRLMGIEAGEIKEREELSQKEGVQKAVEGKVGVEMKRLELGRGEEEKKKKGQRRQMRDSFKQDFKMFGDLITPRRNSQDVVGK